jgi:hypothetical protein
VLPGRVSRCGERFEARERGGQFAGPAPRCLQAQRGGVGVKGQPRSDVQQPVAQAFGLGFGELAGQQQPLCPDDQVVRESHDLELSALVSDGLDAAVSSGGAAAV